MVAAIFEASLDEDQARRLADHYFNNVIGNPLDSTVALHYLIFGGVLADNPNLKLVVAHGGGFLPAYPGRIDHAAAARPDCCERIHRMPTTYLKRVYFDALVYTHHQLDYLVDQYGADHILMGTDYPENILPDDDGAGFLEAVTPILTQPDVTFGNLEGVLQDGGEPVKRSVGSA